MSVRATGGFVVVAAYGAQALEPVQPGEMPFGVTEPIFVGALRRSAGYRLPATGLNDRPQQRRARPDDSSR